MLAIAAPAICGKDSRLSHRRGHPHAADRTLRRIGVIAMWWLLAGALFTFAPYLRTSWQSTFDRDGPRYFATCEAARAANRAPILAGTPGYRRALDRDGDGIACEPKPFWAL